MQGVLPVVGQTYSDCFCITVTSFPTAVLFFRIVLDVFCTYYSHNDQGRQTGRANIGQEPYHFFLLLILFMAFTALALSVCLYSTSFKETSKYVSTAFSYQLAKKNANFRLMIL